MNRVRQKSLRRSRRGATLVLVALLTVVLVGLAAFAVDLSRFHVGAKELQTGADAAALRGAMRLQFNRGVSPVDSTVAFARTNNALNGQVELANADVQPIFWDPAGNPIETNLNGDWANANAVAVTASRARGLLLGRVLNAVNASPSRRSIAWVANITRITCPTPWGFPLTALNDVLYNAPDYTVRNNAFDVLDDKLSANGTGPYSVAMIFYPSDEPPPTALGQEWPFEAIDDADAGGNSMNAYADQIASAGTSCGANSATAIGETEAFPGKGKGAVPKKTVNGAFGGGPAGKVESLCEKFANNSKRVDCYPVGSGHNGAAGVDVVVSWISTVAGKSAQVLSIGGFRVMCVFGTTKGGGKGGPAETCDFYTNYKASAYAQAGLPTELGEGTIVGYPVPITPGLGAGTQVGNAPSLAQRLILVR